LNKSNYIDEKELNHLYRQAKASVELEGFEFTTDDEKTIKSVLRGEKTIEKLIDELKKPIIYPEQEEQLIVPENIPEDEKTEEYKTEK